MLNSKNNNGDRTTHLIYLTQIMSIYQFMTGGFALEHIIQH